jgi:hypothetical protein
VSNRWRIAAAAAVLVAVAAFAYFKLSNDGTVTLNVTGADIHDVVKAISRQSGKEIILSPNASGTVTINIRKKSVAEALEAVSVQAYGWWQEFYAVAANKDAIEAFKKSQRDGGRAEGWTRSQNMFGGFGGRRMSLGGSPKEVTYSTAATPARDVALALTYRMSGEVVVEDTIADASVTIALEKQKPETAVSIFADRIGATHDHFFVLRAGNRSGGAAQQIRDAQAQGNNPPPWMTGNRQGQGGRQLPPRADDSGASPNAPTPAQPTSSDPSTTAPTSGAATQPNTAPSTVAPNSSTPVPSGNTSSQPRPPRMVFGGFGRGGAGGGARLTPEQQAQADKEWQRQLNAMTPEQRKQIEEIGNQMRNVSSPQEAMQVIQNYVNKNPSVLDEGNRMMMERLKASTPEQRVDFYKQVEQMRKAMQQFQQNQSAPPVTIPPPPSNP